MAPALWVPLVEACGAAGVQLAGRLEELATPYLSRIS